MRGASIFRTLALGFAVAGLAAACRSLPTSPPSSPGGGFVSYNASLPSDAQARARAFASYAAGIHHEALGDFGKAEAAYRDALAANPDSEEAAIRVAVSLAGQRRLKDALSFAEAYVADHPAAQSVTLWLIAAYLDADEHVRAEELSRAMAKNYPTNALGWGLWAQSVLDAAPDPATANPAPAIDILERGVAATPAPAPLREEIVRLTLRQLRHPAPDADPAALRARAIAQLRALDAEVPPDRDTLSTLAELLLQDGAIDEAFTLTARIDALEAPAAIAKPHIHAALLNGFKALPSEEAVSILERLAAADPSSPTPYLYLGELLYARRDLEAAAEAYRHATALAPTVSFYWCKRAAMHSDDGRPDLALSALSDGLRVLPGNASLLELAGIISASTQRYAEAADFLAQAEAAFAADPSAAPTPLFHSTAADTYTHLRRPDEAARHLLLATEQTPDARPLERFSQLAHMGSPSIRKNAIATLRALARLSPDHAAPIHLHLALLALETDNPKAALREFRKAIPLLPGGTSGLVPELRFFYAVALDKAGHTDDAIEVLRALVAAAPTISEPRNYLAYTLAILDRDLPEALEHIQAALAAAPDNYAYLDTLAWVFYQQGNYSEAWAAIQKAVDAAPTPLSDEMQSHYDAIHAALFPASDALPSVSPH